MFPRYSSRICKTWKRIRKVRNDNIIFTLGGGGNAINKNSALLIKQTSKQPNASTRKINDNSTNIIASRDGVSLYEFSDNGVHLKTIDPITARVYTEFSYDTDGRLSAITDENGLDTNIERDADDQISAIISPYGKRTELSYFPNGLLEQVKDPLMNSWDFEYLENNLTAFTDRNNNRYEFTYNAFGQLLSDLNPIGGGWQITTPDDVEGSLQVTMTTGEGRDYSFFKDKTIAFGENILYRETKPDGTETVRNYSPRGDTITYPDGTVYQNRFSGTSRLGNHIKFIHQASITSPAGLETTVINKLDETVLDPDTVTPVLQSIFTSTVNGQNWIQSYDINNGDNGGYVFTSPEMRTSTIELGFDQKIKSSEVTGFNPVNISYDADGRVDSIVTGTGADLRESTLTYYNSGIMNGELHTITNALGQTASFEYDANGRVSKQILADLREIIYTYDANGNLKSLTPPGRPIHSFDYTGMDQESQYTPPGLASITTPQTSYNYNLDEQITKITRPDGQEVNLNYNAVTGKLDNKVIPSGTYSYGYDATSGKLNQVTSPAGISLDYTFDGFLPLSTTWSGNHTGNVSRSYDDLFRVISRTVNGTDTINYTYDNDNLRISAGAMTISRELQKAGLINGTTLGNVITTNSYSSFAELTGHNAQYSGADIYDVTYTRDKLGRIASKTETINATSTTYEYDYDVVGRLIEEKTNNVVTNNWEYDSNGNRTHINGVLIATYDDQDRLLTYGGNAYTYTDNGELLTKTNGADLTTYNYDVLGNLLSVTQPDGTLIEYLIDPRGRRVGKKVNGILIKGWLYKDKLNPIAELDGTGNIVSRFIYGDSDNIPSYMVKNGTTYRIITNHLGSPIKLIDTITGVIAQEISYDVWGSVSSDTSSEFQPFGFAGGIYDADTRLTRFGYRDYDAISASWTSKDPIKFKGGDSI